MTELFQMYPLAAWSVVATLAVICLIAALWEKVKWWWLNTWYNFPIIGKATRLSNDSNNAANTDGWFKAERTLCQDYKSFIRIQSEYDFNEKIAYLNKAGDNGRKSTPVMIWVLTVILVFIEAKGFSYVLAGYTVPGASESNQEMAANGLSIIISVIAVAFTHFAGIELYKTFKIRAARRAWIGEGRARPLHTQSITLADPQSTDDGEREYTQVSNRVGVETSYVVTWATILFVIVIAVTATIVRGQTAEKILGESVRTQKSEIQAPAGPASGLDMGAGKNVIPENDLKSSKDADFKGVDEGAELDRRSYWFTFGLLAFLFVFLQGLGVLFGYRWGFAGRNSKAAYKALRNGRYATYEDVRDDVMKVADKAQSMLENLQQRMMDRHGKFGMTGNFHTKRTFDEFLAETQMAEEQHRAREREKTKERRRQDRDEAAQTCNAIPAPPTGPKVTVIPVAQTAPQAPPSFPPALTSDPSVMPVVENNFSDVDRALVKFDEFGDDAAAKHAFLQKLPETLFQDVKAAIKNRKSKASLAQKQRDAEIGDLL